MAEGDSTNTDAADAGTESGREIGNSSESNLTAGSEAAGNDPAGFESSGVGDPQQQQGGGEGGGEGGGQGGSSGNG